MRNFPTEAGRANRFFVYRLAIVLSLGPLLNPCRSSPTSTGYLLPLLLSRHSPPLAWNTIATNAREGPVYSLRSVAAGSTSAALRAGTRHAASATAASTAAVVPNVTCSVAATPYSRPRKNLVSVADPPLPHA